MPFETSFKGPVRSVEGYKIGTRTSPQPLIGVVGYSYFDQRIVAGVASVADGGTIATGLTSISSLLVTASGAGHIASGTASNGTITVALKSVNSGSGLQAVTVAENVNFLAIGPNGSYAS